MQSLKLHIEIYLLGLKVQYKPKFKLPIDVVSKHVLLYFQLPGYKVTSPTHLSKGHNFVQTSVKTYLQHVFHHTRLICVPRLATISRQ